MSAPKKTPTVPRPVKTAMSGSRVAIVDETLGRYERDMRARLKPGVHLVFADEDTATSIARLAHLNGCELSVIDRMDVSGADAILDDAARAAVVLDAERNARDVALEDTLRVFDYDEDGALCAREIAAAIAASDVSAASATTSAKDAASAAARAIAMFDERKKGALGLADFTSYADSSESALGEVPYGAHAVWPEAALEVRASRIAGAGLGLFATTDIAAHSVICEYTGSELTLVEVAFLQDSTYLMGGLGLTCHVDAREHPHVLSRYINDGGSAETQNARFIQMPSRRRACVQATRAIRKGEEIYASYGTCYWAGGVAPTRPVGACAPTPPRDDLAQ